MVRVLGKGTVLLEAPGSSDPATRLQQKCAAGRAHGRCACGTSLAELPSTHWSRRAPLTQQASGARFTTLLRAARDAPPSLTPLPSAPAAMRPSAGQPPSLQRALRLPYPLLLFELWTPSTTPHRSMHGSSEVACGRFMSFSCSSCSGRATCITGPRRRRRGRGSAADRPRNAPGGAQPDDGRRGGGAVGRGAQLLALAAEPVAPGAQPGATPEP